MDESVCMGVLSPTEDKHLSIHGMESIAAVSEVQMKNIEKFDFEFVFFGRVVLVICNLEEDIVDYVFVVFRWKCVSMSEEDLL